MFTGGHPRGAAMQHISAENGSEGLLRTVRAGLTAHGDSLRAWCLRDGVGPSYAHRVLAGVKNGPAAVALRKRLISASIRDGA